MASLDELKEHLNVTGSSSDAELTRMLNAAHGVVENLIGDRSAGTVTETVQVRAGTALLSRRPSGPVTVGADPAPGTVNEAAGIITDLTWLVVPTGRLTVTYPVGSDAVPADISLAVLIIAAHLWETQRGTSPSQLALQQPGGDEPFATGRGFALPNRAKELLEPYVGQAQVA